MNLDMSIVADKSKLAKFVHEVAYAASRGPDHFRQRCLADIRIDRLWAAFLAEIGEHQQQARESPLARIEELVDKVLLNPAVSGQQIGHEQLRKRRLIMDDGHHRGFRDRRY